MIARRYYEELATAFVRGRLGRPDATVADGVDAGLRLHKFKRDTTLARVQKVLGILRGIAPATLLDVGSGRGTFLWPLLDTFPDLEVTSIDIHEQRIVDLEAVHSGGIARLRAVRMDAEQMSFGAGSFDVVTMLEVLEHMRDPQAALTRAMAVAARFVVVSVPSVPDDNPEHIHLFRPEDLQHMATVAGARRVTIEHVLNHRIAVLQ